MYALKSSQHFAHHYEQSKSNSSQNHACIFVSDKSTNIQLQRTVPDSLTKHDHESRNLAFFLLWDNEPERVTTRCDNWSREKGGVQQLKSLLPPATSRRQFTSSLRILRANFMSISTTSDVAKYLQQKNAFLENRNNICFIVRAFYEIRKHFAFYELEKSFNTFHVIAFAKTTFYVRRKRDKLHVLTTLYCEEVNPP